MNDVDFRELSRLAESGGALAMRAIEHLKLEVYRLKDELARAQEEGRRLRRALSDALVGPEQAPGESTMVEPSGD